MVKANKDAFLGSHFLVHDGIYDENHACIRYTMETGGDGMEVAVWFYFSQNLIDKIVSYYNVGNASYDTNMNQPNQNK